MAKRRVKISLATKLRLLYGLTVLGVIAAALTVPWYFMELLAEQGVLRPGAELTRLRLNEWLREHPKDPAAAEDKASKVAGLYTTGEGVTARAGPSIVVLIPGRRHTEPLDTPGRKASKAFMRNESQELAIIEDENVRGELTYRVYRAVRAQQSCMECHGQTAPQELRYSGQQLAAMVRVTLPGETASTPLAWWTRGAFVVGALLAGMVALVLFALISHRILLKPIRSLHNLTDKVAEGKVSARCRIKTGDELQRLGESFNEMLDAINSQHDKLRSANRALDLKLSELAEANVTLFRADKVKSEFLANVSHELRTPLNSIIGFADLLAEREDERVRRYGANISSAAKNLLNMINDLLDMAKVEAGKVDVRLDKVSVTDTCETLLQLLAPLADKNRLALRSELADDVPIIVTDAGKVQQILYNLLSNAVKFTPAGGSVTLATELIADDQGEPLEVAISVTDTGPGIPEAEQARIFDKFYQVDPTLIKQAHGTGLGLAIAKDLSVLLGGRLGLASSPGHGATFTLALPIAPAEQSKGH
jgi:two-component system sensor histidine kinase BarA